MEKGVSDRKALLESELERFVEVASEELGAERVILFGSLARALEGDEGALGEWPDLDLVVVAETEQPFYKRIVGVLDRVRPKVGADVFVYTPSEWERVKADRPFIREEVLRGGKVVYERVGWRHW